MTTTQSTENTSTNIHSAQSCSGLVVTTTRGALNNALTTVGHAVPTRPTVPALGGVLLHSSDGHELTISATDDNMSVSIGTHADACAPGTVVLDHAEIVKLLAALVKGIRRGEAGTLPVTIRVDGDTTALLDLAGYIVPLTSYPADDYPTIPDATPAVVCTDRAVLAREWARVLAAVESDNPVPMFTGIHLTLTEDAVTLAGTDRYRLALARIPTAVASTCTASALVPGRRMAPLLTRLTGQSVSLGMDDPTAPTRVSLSCADTTVTIRPFLTDYPDIGRLIPDRADVTVQVDRAALLAAARRARAVLDATRNSAGRVVLTATTDTVTLAPAVADHNNPVTAPAIAATVTDSADTTRFWFQPRYLVDALNSFDRHTITLHLPANPARPVVFTDTPHGLADSTAFRHVLMPVRPPES